MRFPPVLFLLSLPALASCAHAAPLAPVPPSPVVPTPAPVVATPSLPAPGPIVLRVDRRIEGEPSWLVVLLHGYASDASDLEPLARVIAVPTSTRVIVPSAPLEGPGTGRAWWPLEPNRIAERTRDPGVLEREDPAGLSTSSALVRDLIARERGASRVLVAGFSQGAMLAVSVALELSPPPDALVVLAGALLARERLERRMISARGLRVMVAHGRDDAVVPFVAGVALRDAFQGAGIDVRFTAFEGGHGVGPEVIEDVDRFVYELSGTASTL